MKLSDYPLHFQHLYSMHEAFRRLGFTADEVFYGFGPIFGVGDDIVYAKLVAQEKEFVVCVAQVRQNEELVWGEWREFHRALMAAPEQEVQEIWVASPIGSSPQAYATLIGTLVKRGFRIPALGDASKEELAVLAKMYGKDQFIPKAIGEA